MTAYGPELFLEIFGYCASVLVALSLMMKNIKKLRWWNLLGAGLFSIYGMLIGALPVFILNGFIALVDVYYLRKLYLVKDTFELLSVNPKVSAYLRKFVSFYRDDIAEYFPEFKEEQLNDEGLKAYLILRDMLPVSLILFKQKDDKEQIILLDYAVPSYRDLKNASFFYCHKSEELQLPNNSYYSVDSCVPAHERYLQKMGFQKQDGESCKFIKEI